MSDFSYKAIIPERLGGLKCLPGSFEVFFGEGDFLAVGGKKRRKLLIFPGKGIFITPYLFALLIPSQTLECKLSFRVRVLLDR